VFRDACAPALLFATVTTLLLSRSVASHMSAFRLQPHPFDPAPASSGSSGGSSGGAGGGDHEALALLLASATLLQVARTTKTIVFGMAREPLALLELPHMLFLAAVSLDAFPASRPLAADAMSLVLGMCLTTYLGFAVVATRQIAGFLGIRTLSLAPPAAASEESREAAGASPQRPSRGRTASATPRKAAARTSGAPAAKAKTPTAKNSPAARSPAPRSASRRGRRTLKEAAPRAATPRRSASASQRKGRRAD
jgi:hypothetical protein